MFTVEEELINCVGKELILHGLDGYAYIYLNNKYIGLATNSFVRYRYDITQYLKVIDKIHFTLFDMFLRKIVNRKIEQNRLVKMFWKSVSYLQSKQRIR